MQKRVCRYSAGETALGGERFHLRIRNCENVEAGGLQCRGIPAASASQIQHARMRLRAQTFDERKRKRMRAAEVGVTRRKRVHAVAASDYRRRYQ